MANIKISDSYVKEDIAHLLHGAVEPSKFDKNGSLIWSEAHGTRVRDISGKEYIDVAAGAGCVNIGYGRRELAEVAREQMIRLSYCPNFGGTASPPTIELAHELSKLTPEGLDRFCFTNGGSEANEINFKLVRWYWGEQGKKKHKIISLEGGYHGQTYGALCACGMPEMHKHYDPETAGFTYIPGPHCYKCAFDKSYPDCDIDCAQALEEAILKEGEENVGAFIAETIQSRSLLPPPPEYWSKIRKICTEHNVLLILDEVMCGFGRTGKFWACEHYEDLKPDLMTFGKGLASVYSPLAGVALSEEIYKGITKNDLPFMAIFTTAGHPVSCAVALKGLEIIERENLVENSAKVGAYMLDRLSSLKEQLPIVRDVRGVGLFIGLELVSDQLDPKVGEEQIEPACLEKGLILRFGEYECMMMPPLTLTTDEVDFIVDALRSVLENLQLG